MGVGLRLRVELGLGTGVGPGAGAGLGTSKSTISCSSCDRNALVELDSTASGSPSCRRFRLEGNDATSLGRLALDHSPKAPNN